MLKRKMKSLFFNNLENMKNHSFFGISLIFSDFNKISIFVTKL